VNNHYFLLFYTENSLPHFLALEAEPELSGASSTAKSGIFRSVLFFYIHMGGPKAAHRYTDTTF
jgi:hypothetical protein